VTATDELRLRGVGASMPELLRSADGRVELVLGAGQLDRRASRLPFGGVVVSLLGVADRFIVVDGTLKAPHARINSGDLLVEGAAA
jgi:hypothetical protein